MAEKRLSRFSAILFQTPRPGEAEYAIIPRMAMIDPGLIENISQALTGECHLDKGQKVLVAVSGGTDSLCLLHVLWQLGYPLVVAHLDHKLRPEAEAEAQAVQALAAQLGLLCVLGVSDAEAYAAEHGLSIEEAARLVRYRFLFEQAEAYQAQAVATGHTADDQVETVLMHLLRGAGLSGLTGMAYRSLPNPWSEKIALVRPLLGTWHADVLAYDDQQDLAPALDPSNSNTRFFRNRLRHALIPYLESFNPQVRQTLWRTADVLREDEAALEGLTQAAWTACFHDQGPGWIALQAEVLQGEPLALRRRLLRRAIDELRPGLQDVDFAAIERGLAFLAAPSHSGQSDLVAGLKVFIEEGLLWLASWQASLPANLWPHMPGDCELHLEAGEACSLPEGWKLRAEVLPAGELDQSESGLWQAFSNADPFQAWLDAGRLRFPLRVRARRPGDRFAPLGMEGHSLKLSDFMINIKLPRRARAGWPLVLSGERIAWIPGLRVGHPFRIQPGTANIVHLKLTNE